MTNNMNDSSFALVPEEAARQEIENLRKENSELKTKIEAYKQLPATLEDKLREKESELARSEADYKWAMKENGELADNLRDANRLCVDLFTELADKVIGTDNDDEKGKLKTHINGLTYLTNVIKAMLYGDGLEAFEDAIDPVIADSKERLELFTTFLRLADSAISLTVQEYADD